MIQMSLRLFDVFNSELLFQRSSDSFCVLWVYDVLVVLGLLISFCAPFCSFSLMFVFCLCQLHIFESWSQCLLFPVLFWCSVVTRVLCLVLLPLAHPLSLVSAVLTCFLSPHYLLCIIVSVSACPFVVVLEELLFWIVCAWSVVVLYLVEVHH